MLIEYRISTLAELQQMITNILEEASAAAGRTVTADEVYVGTEKMRFIEGTVTMKTLSDQSNVFDLEF